MVGFVVLCALLIMNAREFSYLIESINIRKHQAERAKVVDMILSKKLNDFTYKGCANWINLPDSLKHLSEGGNVRVEVIDKKVSVFFYLRDRLSEESVGVAYFGTPMTTSRIMSINDPNSFFFRDEWVKSIDEHWFYIANIINTEPEP